MKSLPELIQALRNQVAFSLLRDPRPLIREAADHLEAAQAGAFFGGPTVVKFGEGKLVVGAATSPAAPDQYLVVIQPAVLVAPPGSPCSEAEERDTFHGDEIILSFPTKEQAEIVSDALCNVLPSVTGQSAGALDVLAERQRQKDKEGWTAEHDGKWKRGEMRYAAACYVVGGVAYMWPWDMKWWKPGSIRRNLIKAAALLIAEIDRIDRDAARRIAPLEGDTDGSA